MKVAFRVDASPEIGMGHLMRCLALSQELTRRGHSCYIVSKTNNRQLLDMIMNYKVANQKIKPTATLKEDLDILLKFSKNHEVDWVITDHYGIDDAYLKAIKQQGLNMLSIDDTAQLHYCSDIVVNQNIGAEHLRFSTGPPTKLLLGTNYVMLRAELLQREKKKEQPSVKKILITLGSSDPDNFILKILQSLVPVSSNVEFLVVLGPFYQFLSDFQTYMKKMNAPITILNSPTNMADAYLAADLAVSAGGSSCYELSYFGIPSLIITIAKNQEHLSKELDNQQVGIYLGEKNKVNMMILNKKFKELLENHSLRHTMSINGRKLIDGKGKKRIVDMMERFQ